MEVTPDKTVAWQYIGPDNTEIHSLQPIGLDRVLLAQNGNPAVALLINKATNTVEKTFTIPVAKPDSVHGQLRRARLTAAGTLLVAQMDSARVVEYDEAGKVLWSVAADSPWGAVGLKNGNTLISNWVAGAYKPAEWPKTVQVFEVTADKKIVWALSSWNNPNLGPATSMQLLDQPGLAENGDLQR
jgi:hypothetical protein